MTLFVGNEKIYNIHHGSDRIYRVYKGSDLVWKAYKINETVFTKTTSGSATLNLIMAGQYRVRLVGAGGGGAYNSSDNRGSGAAGNSGGMWYGIVRLSEGTYTVNVGAGGAKSGGLDANTWGGNGGNTTLSLGGTTLIVAGGGTGNHVWWPNSNAHNSIVSVANSVASSVQQISVSSNVAGNWGGLAATASGGASRYNGYGKGGDVRNRYAADNGVGGYFSIEFVGE
jgi:hypothetical protein